VERSESGSEAIRIQPRIRYLTERSASRSFDRGRALAASEAEIHPDPSEETTELDQICHYGWPG